MDETSKNNNRREMKLFHIMRSVAFALCFLLSTIQGETTTPSDFTRVYPDDSFGIDLKEFATSTKSLFAKSTTSRREDGRKNMDFPSTVDNTTNTQFSFRRILAPGDFDALNGLLGGAVIRLEDFSDSQSFGFFNGGLTVANIFCKNLAIEDVLLDYNKESNQRLIFRIDFPNINFDCEMDFFWNFGMIRDGGKILVSAGQSSGAAVVAFASENFDVHGPQSAVSESCVANVNFSELQFQGSVTAAIMNWLKDSIVNAIESQVNNLVCSELEALIAEFAGSFVEMAGEKVMKYTEPVESWRLDPIHLEQTVQVPTDVELINFNDAEGVSGFFVNAINMSSFYFQNEFLSSTGTNELGINTFIRDYMLEDDGSFALNITDLPVDFDAVLFEGHDKFTQTRIAMKGVKVFGLDSFTKFEPFTDVGNRTYQISAAWDTLTMEVYIELETKASSLPDSVIQADQSEPILENFKIDFGLDNVDAQIAMLLGVDLSKLEQLNLGSLLFMESMFDCFLSIFHDFSFSGMHFSVGNIREPSLSGFISPGIDRVATQSAAAAFLMFEKVMLDSFPSFFQSTVRDNMNAMMVDNIRNAYCPPPEIQDQYIDFRDLILQPEESTNFGGHGDQRYGELFSYAFDFLRSQTQIPDADGLSRVNSALIRPLTSVMGAGPGMLEFDSEYTFDLLKQIELTMSDASLKNMDTIMAPMELLQPTWSPYTLLNRLVFGPVEGRPLSAKFNLGLNILREDSTSYLSNELEINISTASLETVADIFAKLYSSRFLQFPLKDFFNYNCWLSALHPPSHNGAEGINAGGFFFPSALTKTNDFTMNMRCRDCTENSPTFLLEIEKLNENAMLQTFGSSLVAYLGETLQSSTFRSIMDEMVVEAPKYCPHSPQFEGSETTDVESFQDMLPSIIIKVAMSELEGFFGFLNGTKNSTTNVMLSESDFKPPEGARILNWTNLEELSPAFSMMFEQARSVLTMESSRRLNELVGGMFDSALGFEEMFDQFFVSEINIPLEDMQYEIGSSKFSVDSIRIHGLDSIISYDMLNPSRPYILQNSFRFQKLAFELNMTVLSNMTNNKPRIVTMSTEANDIDATMPLFLAIDIDAIDALELGSLLNTENLMPCFFSSVMAMFFTEINVTFRDLSAPTLQGLDPEIDLTFSNFARTTFNLFRKRILRSISGLMENLGRPMINLMMAKYVEESVCPSAIIQDEFIDYRDLLLKAPDSRLYGGSGDMRYGNTLITMYDFLHTQGMAEDDNGMARINSLIRPFTESQSGVQGMFRFDSEVSLNFSEQIQLRFSNSSMKNLDTVMAPLEIMKPTRQPYSLLNNIIIGPILGRPLNATTTFGLNVFNEDSTPYLSNEMDISVSAASLKFLTDTFAKLNSTKFLRFPLKDISNIFCWLSTLHTHPAGMETISGESGFLVNSALTEAQDFSLNLRCRNCTGPASSFLYEMEGLGDSEAVRNIGSSVIAMVGGILESELFQTVMDRLLLESPQYCPHSPQYIHSDEGIDVSSIQDFAIYLLKDVGLTALMDSLGVLGPAEASSNVVYTEANFSAPDGTRVLDFTNLEESSPMFNIIFREIRKIAVSETGRKLDETSGSLSGGFFGLKQLIDQYVGKFSTIPIKGLEFNLASLMFSIDSITINGLDSLTYYDLLRPIGSHTLDNSFHFEMLSFELNMTITDNTTDAEARQVALFIEASDISASVPLFLAIDLEVLEALELGSLLYTNNILQCVVSSIIAMSLPPMNITLGDLSPPALRGMDSQMGEAFSSLTRALFNVFGGRILQGFSSFIDSYGRPVFNELISALLAVTDCENLLALEIKANRTSDEFLYVDFRDLLLSEEDAKAYGGSGKAPYGDLFQYVFNFLQSLLKVDEITGLADINQMIGSLTKARSNEAGTLLFPGNIVNQGMRFILGSSEAVAAIRISDVKIENFDTFGAPLSLIDPIVNQANQLNNSVSVGVGELPLRASLGFMIAYLPTVGDQIYNDLTMRVDVYRATAVMTALLKVAEERFAMFPLRDFLNVDCWLATIPVQALHGMKLEELDPNAAIEYLKASVAQLDLNLECNNCSSRVLNDWVEILGTAEAAKDLTSATNGVLDYIAELTQGDYFFMELNRMLNDAAGRCPHRAKLGDQALISNLEIASGKSGKTISHAIILVIACGVFFVCVAITMFTIRTMVRRRHLKWLMSLPKQHLYSLVQQQKMEEKKQSELADLTTSMFSSPSIPVVVRYFIPLIIFGNVGMFLSGHLSLGASVNIAGGIAGQQIVIENFFEFSMAKSTMELWKAGARELPILILIFSGIWPYTKLLITLAMWFLPPKIVSLARRESILLWLDILAKWSMVDIFTFIVSLVAFRVSANSPDVGFLPANLYTFDFFVVPMWGLYANFLAQVISQISSHVIIHYHRKMISEATKKLEGGSKAALTSLEDCDSDGTDSVSGKDKKYRLCHHSFARSHRDDAELTVRGFVNFMLCIVALALFALLIVGACLPTFSQEVYGIIGVLVELGQNFREAVVQHSIASMVNLIMDEAKFLGTVTDYVGLITFTSLFIFCVLVVPLLQTLVLLYQWFCPLTETNRFKISVLLEILQAWQYTEVFVISAIVASWQLGPTSLFMINRYCRSLDQSLKMLGFLGVLDAEDVQCFQLEASIEVSTYLIVAAALLLAFLNTFVVKASRQLHQDKYTSAYLSEKVQHVSLDESEFWWEESGAKEVKNIKPVAVLFSDTFRWCLVSIPRDDEILNLGTKPTGSDISEEQNDV